MPVRRTERFRSGILSPLYQRLKFFPILMYMNYYALQVKTRGEEKYIRLFRYAHPEIRFPIYFPRRLVKIRRKGKVYEETSAIFPGYLFIEVDDDNLLLEKQWYFRHIDGFHRFLRSNQNVSPLAGRDLETVLYFLKKVGPIAGPSKAYFDENKRIVVTEGPLLGLMGRIVKIDRRKKRAKIKLDLYDDSFAIDLAFDMIRPEHK